MLTEATGQPNDIVVFDQVSAAVATGPLLDSLPITHRLDGLLIMGLPLEDHLARRLVQRHLPTVLVDSRRPEFTSITINDEHGGYLAGRHLVERGHTRFAVLSEPQRSSSYLSQAELRRTGFRKAIAEALDITTIRQPLETSGRLGLRLLHEALADPQQPVQQIELELQLVQRRST